MLSKRLVFFSSTPDSSQLWGKDKGRLCAGRVGLEGVARLALGTISLPGPSVSPEVWEGAPETFPNSSSPHRLGLGRDRDGHSLIHIAQRGWAKGLGGVQGAGVGALTSLLGSERGLGHFTSISLFKPHREPAKQQPILIFQRQRN